MKRATLVSLIALAALVAPAVAAAQQLVIVVRHAERADGGAPTMGTKADPPLSAAGKARADKLADMLSASGITAIYATEFVRTQQTAAPLAAALKLTTTIRPSSETTALAAELKASHARDIVLIVGHSNTVPAIIKALGGPVVTVGDDEYDKLFVVVPSTGALTTFKY
jgi:broad specificity phosphatase PhoE